MSLTLLISNLKLMFGNRFDLSSQYNLCAHIALLL